MKPKDTNSIKTQAIKFFNLLAAGVPLSNCTWGKSERETRDFYALAARSIASSEKGIEVVKE